MRVFILIAVVCFVLALIAAGVPTLIIGLNWNFWCCAGLLAWLLDGFPASIQPR